MKRKSYLYLLATLLFTIVTVIIITTQHVVAKDGVIVGGDNGTKWCCPGGVKGDGCVKGNSSTPLKARCNFADMVAPPKSTTNLKPGKAAPIDPITAPEKAELSPKTTVQTTKVRVYWGRKKKQCHGDGICIIRTDTGPHCLVDNDAREIPLDRKVEGVAKVEQSRITLELTTAPPTKANEIVIDEDIEIGKCSSRLLGYESISVLKGTYNVSLEGAEFGKIILPTKSQPLDSRMR